MNNEYMKGLIRTAVMPGTQKAFAERHGVSKATLCEILKGDCQVPDSFARLIGYKKIGKDVYERV